MPRKLKNRKTFRRKRRFIIRRKKTTYATPGGLHSQVLMCKRSWNIGATALNLTLVNDTASSGYGAGGNGSITYNGAPDSNFQITPCNAGTSTYSGISFSVCLQDVPNYTEFTTLFDQYKISGYSWRLIPQNTVSAAVQTLNPALGKYTATSVGAILHSVHDYDDANAVTTTDVGVSYLRQYKSYQARNLFMTKTGVVARYNRWPKVDFSVMNSSGTGSLAGIMNAKKAWFDCNNSTIQHFGTKMIIEHMTNDINQEPYYFKLEGTIYFKFKQVV